MRVVVPPDLYAEFGIRIFEDFQALSYAWQCGALDSEIVERYYLRLGCRRAGGIVLNGQDAKDVYILPEEAYEFKQITMTAMGRYGAQSKDGDELSYTDQKKQKGEMNT